MKFITNKRELLSAGVLLMIGLATAIGGANYRFGSLDRMGPGYFPIALGIILIIISALIVVTPVSMEDATVAPRPEPQYRAWACVVGGVVAFMALGSYAGLVPGTFALILISALGDKGNSLKSAAWLAVAVTILAVVVFRMLLQMQFPLFTWM